MSLAKTESGRDALQDRSPLLRPRERQILILANGTRSRAEMLQMLGEGAAAEVDRLITLGLLADARLGDIRTTSKDVLSMTGTFSASALKVPPVAASVAPLAAARAMPVQSVPPVVPAPAAAAPSPPPAARAKRSLVAAKMYTIDMLQLLRDMDASAMAVSIQTSATEAELMTSVMSSMRYIRAKSGTSYALKVMTRLEEIIPEGWLAELGALAAEFAGPSFSESP